MIVYFAYFYNIRNKNLGMGLPIKHLKLQEHMRTRILETVEML